MQRSAIARTERLAYRVNDFCDLVGVGRTKTYELIADGTLKTVVVGRRRLILHEGVEALLKQGASK
jgi:excisionase family DNA binding protein